VGNYFDVSINETNTLVPYDLLTCKTDAKIVFTSTC